MLIKHPTKDPLHPDMRTALEEAMTQVPLEYSTPQRSGLTGRVHSEGTRQRRQKKGTNRIGGRGDRSAAGDPVPVHLNWLDLARRDSPVTLRLSDRRLHSNSPRIEKASRQGVPESPAGPGPRKGRAVFFCVSRTSWFASSAEISDC